MPCGIEVNDQDIYYNVTWDDGSVHQVRGVRGTTAYDGGPFYAATQGDSGGLVFTIDGSNTRQARGEVSATDPGGVLEVYWTEAPDILSHFGLHLNPYW